MAERVGFVPCEAAHINNLGQFSIPQIARNAQNLSIRYKTGTAKRRIGAMHGVERAAQLQTDARDSQRIEVSGSNGPFVPSSSSSVGPSMRPIHTPPASAAACGTCVRTSTRACRWRIPNCAVKHPETARVAVSQSESQCPPGVTRAFGTRWHSIGRHGASFGSSPGTNRRTRYAAIGVW